MKWCFCVVPWHPYSVGASFQSSFLFFTSLRRDAPFLSVTLNPHKQIIFAVLAEYEYEMVQNLVRVSGEFRELSLSRAERGPGFSPQSLARKLAESCCSGKRHLWTLRPSSFFFSVYRRPTDQIFGIFQKKIKSNDVDKPFLTWNNS